MIRRLQFGIKVLRSLSSFVRVPKKLSCAIQEADRKIDQGRKTDVAVDRKINVGNKIKTER